VLSFFLLVFACAGILSVKLFPEYFTDHFLPLYNQTLFRYQSPYSVPPSGRNVLSPPLSPRKGKPCLFPLPAFGAIFPPRQPSPALPLSPRRFFPSTQTDFFACFFKVNSPPFFWIEIFFLFFLDLFFAKGLSGGGFPPS